jgi:hypothetical protein
MTQPTDAASSLVALASGLTIVPTGEKKKTDSKKTKPREPSLNWSTEMVEYALELRFDSTKITAKRFQTAKNNANVWDRLLIFFKEKCPEVIVNDRNNICSKLDKLKAEYRECIRKFQETGNNIEETVEDDEFFVQFKKDEKC